MASCQPKRLAKVYNTLLWSLGLDRSCLLCGGIAPLGVPLCAPCQPLLPWLTEANCCPRCNLPGTCGHLCPRCQHAPFHFSRCLAAVSYQEPVNHLITEYKYGYRKAVLPALADPLWVRLQHHYGGHWPDLLLSVPQHPKRLQTRGFDQAALLARYLSEKTSIPYRSNQLQRLRHTPSQQTLCEKTRRKNIRGAFGLKAALAEKHIVLIDDVVTSGATVDELSQLLIKSGAEQVDVWALARTPFHRHSS